jgi:DNA-binding transcriptional LysR family regulator
MNVRDMSVRDIEAFLAVVETGSIVAGSSAVNITQPGLTRRIQSLETALGAPLLDRQSKPLKPTALGREVYEHGRRVLRALQDLKSAAAPQGVLTGELRLGITPSLSETALTEALDELRTAYPKLSLRISSGWAGRLLENVARSQLDAAAMYMLDGMAPSADLIAERVARLPVLLVAPRDLPLPKSPSLQDLSNYPWIMNEDGCGLRGAVKHIMESARLPFHIGVEAQSGELRLSLVARGFGITIVTSPSLRASAFRDAVKVIDAPQFRPHIHVWLVHRPPAGRLEGPIRAFGDAFGRALRAGERKTARPTGARKSR